MQHRSGSNQRLTYEGILSFVLYHFSLLKCPVIRVFRECVSRVDSCPCPRDLASRVSVPVHVSSVGLSSINDTVYAPILLWAEVQTHSRVSIRFLGGVYMMEYCHLGVIQDGLPSEPV